MHTTVGQLLVNEALPEDLRDHGRVMDKKALHAVLREVALKHPEQYVAVSKKLADIGRHVSTLSGGNSFGLAHLSKAKAGRKYQLQVQAQVHKILDRDDL